MRITARRELSIVILDGSRSDETFPETQTGAYGIGI